MNTRQKKKYIRRCAGKNVRIDWNKPVMGFIGEWAFGPKLINPTIKQRYHELLWSKRWIKQLKKLVEEPKNTEMINFTGGLLEEMRMASYDGIHIDALRKGCDR